MREKDGANRSELWSIYHESMGGKKGAKTEPRRQHPLFLRDADGSCVLGRVAYEISSGLTAGVNISYDEAFETRVSADLKVRFGGASTTAQRKEVEQLPVINALTSTPSNRDVRVHDLKVPWWWPGCDKRHWIGEPKKNGPCTFASGF